MRLMIFIAGLIPPCSCFAPKAKKLMSCLHSIEPASRPHHHPSTHLLPKQDDDADEAESLGRRAGPHPHNHPSSHLLLKQDDDEDDAESLRRRAVLAAPAFISLLLDADVANAAETTAEAIRLLSAKTIPGLGPPDIYYPPYFVGKWKVTKVVSNSDDKFWKAAKDMGIDLPVKIVSEMRFVPYDAGKDFTDDNPNNSPAIADRSFNEKAYYNALSEELSRLIPAAKLPSVQSLNWTPTNPNVLALVYSNGSSKEIKVTKRSSDVEKDGSGLFSSEFRRITEQPASEGVAGGIPTIYKSRLLAKWKQTDGGSDGRVNTIEGIEILYNDSGTFAQNADPMRGGGTGNLLYGKEPDITDWRSTKTRILMERIM